MSDTTEPTYEYVAGALRNSHELLVAVLGPLDDEQVAGPSYDDDWTIAQVASHLGSGAETFELFVSAGLAGRPAPGSDTMKPMWDSWNAKPAPDQARDGLAADESFLQHLESLSTDDVNGWKLDFFGSQRTLLDLLLMRLSEHTVHTWDIAVALDPTATLPDDSAELVVDCLEQVVARSGKPAPDPVTIGVVTTQPDRAFRLDLAGGPAALAPADGHPAGTGPTVKLSSEALIRLVYGRLDPEHTPSSVETSGIDLDTLRRTFPGV